MDKEKRQRRFQQKQRHIERQVDTWNKTQGRGRRFINERVEEPHRLHKLNAFTCSCHTCRSWSNLRKLEGPTIQERRFECGEIE